MYKIYINENIIKLADSNKIKGKKSTKKSLIAPYTGKTKMLLSYIDMLEKTDRFDQIIIHHHDLPQLKADLNSLFKVIKAAGGVVTDEQEKLLFIFRRGHWDLPKGKIDLGERKKDAAIREVMEETGIKNVTLGEKLLTTRHTYRLKSGKRAMKKTYWYRMQAPHQKLTPQIEEDITSVKWVNMSKGLPKSDPIFLNILDVLNKYNKSKRKKATT